MNKPKGLVRLLLRLSIDRSERPLLLRDLAEGRLRLDGLCRNGGLQTFFPCRTPPTRRAARGPREGRHSSRNKKVLVPPSSTSFRPASGCGGRRSGRLSPSRPHRAGSKHESKGDYQWLPSAPSRRPRRPTTPAKSPRLTSQARNVRIVAEKGTSANAPTHRVFVGKAEIGAAWTKRSNEGRDYLSLKLDDPSFIPIFGNLFAEDDGDGYALIWSRPSGRRND